MAKAAADRTEEFLKALGQAPEPETTPAAPHVPDEPAPVSEQPARRRKVTQSRAGLKHFGGYLDDDTLEKIAILRVRLKKDNSELIKFAVDELHRKYNAKRAFGDA